MIPLTGIIAWSAPRCRSPWRHQDFWIILALTFGAYGLSTLIKLLVHRARPQLWKVLTPETDFSYPSGHALISLTVITACIWLAWPTKWRRVVLVAGACFLVLVGLSRLYLGVHYPSDVLGGWLMGAEWAGAVLLIVRPGREASCGRHRA
ncbi:phosphatase PAP2 family protein [Deinococcus detaillensis]|nr:phosphatase PAP2 family protein [Deinococcus detaillensis]